MNIKKLFKIRLSIVSIKHRLKSLFKIWWLCRTDLVAKEDSLGFFIKMNKIPGYSLQPTMKAVNEASTKTRQIHVIKW